MICPNCKAENSPGVEFCTSCGFNFSTSQAPITSGAPKHGENYLYFGIMAILISLNGYMWTLGFFLINLYYKNSGASFSINGIPYKALRFFMLLFVLIPPVLIALKVKSVTIKVVVFILSGLWFIVQTILIFNIWPGLSKLLYG